MSKKKNIIDCHLAKYVWKKGFEHIFAKQFLKLYDQCVTIVFDSVNLIKILECKRQLPTISFSL